MSRWTDNEGKPLIGRPPESSGEARTLPAHLRREVNRLVFKEEMAEKLYGGRFPFFTMQFGESRAIVFGDEAVSISDTATPDGFLRSFIESTLGSEWVRSEGEKESPHPIAAWIKEVDSQVASWASVDPEFEKGVPATGAIYCLLGLAFSLFMLKSASNLPETLVSRLKNNDQFQGAYYETILANVMMRAGFTIEFEDETDKSSSHCEFVAVSRSQKRYSVEGKMRVLDGVLGGDAARGSTRKDATSSLIKQLNEALLKSARHERIIFIDVNDEEYERGPGEPAWVSKARRRLDGKSKTLREGQKAYLFITNLAFHNSPSSDPVYEVLLYALGVEDWNISQAASASELYVQRKLHGEVTDLLGIVSRYPGVPSDFDGDPLSYAKTGMRLYSGNLIKVLGPRGLEVGEINDVSVTSASTANVRVVLADGKLMAVDVDLHPSEYRDYLDYGTAAFGFFGTGVEKSPYDRFCEIMGARRNWTRDRIVQTLERLDANSEVGGKSDEALLLELSQKLLDCEGGANNRR